MEMAHGNESTYIGLIFIGSLNTDIVATGLKRFPRPGEHVFGENLIIGPGGKSRNVADMAAHLTASGTVSMVGRTTKDQYGMWKIPIDALRNSGVNIDYVVIDETSSKMPGVALITVEQTGHNQIVVLPGISDDFCEADIDNAEPLFNEVSANNGIVGLTLEAPISTVRYAAEKAKKHNLKIIFDPGGIPDGTEIGSLLRDMYLVKPNEHEAKTITGITVTNFDSAKQAAERLFELGAKNILITVGVQGAYLFTDSLQKHIPVPSITDDGVHDETGCGDQTMATLSAYLQAGASIEEAADIAIFSGTLQFHKQGIQPVSLSELEAVTNKRIGEP